MNYNTEMLAAIAKQVANLVMSAVQAEHKAGQAQPKIAGVETALREVLREIGQLALGMYLEGMQTTPLSEISCACGGRLRYQRKRSACLVSVFGKVSYERAYYAGCPCKQGKAPLDEQYGLQPGAVTAGLAALLALAGIEFSYERSPEWLSAYLLFDVAANTIRAETEDLGALQAQHEEHLRRQSQDEAELQRRQRQPGVVPTRLYGSLDAAKVRIEPRPKAGEQPPAHEDWRDMKVLCWFETEAVSPAQRSVRQRQQAQRQQQTQRAKNLRYFCDITEAEAFGKLLWASGCSLKADLCPELIFLGDGAGWIWNLVSQYYPQAVQIVDWYHAEEHLEKVAAAAWDEPTKRTAWLEDLTQALWEGRVEAVISACQGLAEACPEARKAAVYFFTHAERMRYERFRAKGYMIGSGTVESGCKQIVTQRLKLPGAQWSVQGAVQTAKARAAWLSGSWQSLCQLRSALPLAI